MNKNENVSENILGDLQDIVIGNSQENYFDALDDLLCIAQDLSTDTRVKNMLKLLMDKQTADKNIYAKYLTKIDKYLHPDAY